MTQLVRRLLKACTAVTLAVVLLVAFPLQVLPIEHALAEQLPAGTSVTTGSYPEGGDIHVTVVSEPGPQTIRFPAPDGPVKQLMSTVTSYVTGSVLYFDIDGTTYSKDISPNSNTVMSFSSALEISNVKMTITGRGYPDDAVHAGYFYSDEQESEEHELPEDTDVSTNAEVPEEWHNKVLSQAGPQTVSYPEPQNGKISGIYATVTTYVSGAVLRFQVYGADYSHPIEPNSNTLLSFENELEVSDVKITIDGRGYPDDAANLGYVYSGEGSSLPEGTKVEQGTSYPSEYYNVAFASPGPQTKSFPEPASGQVIGLFASVTTYVEGAVIHFESQGNAYFYPIQPNSNTLLEFPTELDLSDVMIEIDGRGYSGDQANVGYVYGDIRPPTPMTRIQFDVCPQSGIDYDCSLPSVPSGTPVTVSLQGRLTAELSGNGVVGKTIRLSWPTGSGETNTIQDGNFKLIRTMTLSQGSAYFSAGFPGDSDYLASLAEMTLTVSGQPGLPDLVATDIYLEPGDRPVGLKEDIVCKIENRGDKRSSDFYTSFYVNGKLVDTQGPKSIPNAGQALLVASGAWSKTEGGTTFRCVADTTQSVSESHESNNEFSKTISFGGTEKASSTLSIGINPKQIRMNEASAITISGRLTTGAGNAISGQIISIETNGVTKNVRTGESGEYEAIISTKADSAGKWVVRAQFLGSSSYFPTESSALLEVQTGPPMVGCDDISVTSDLRTVQSYSRISGKILTIGEWDTCIKDDTYLNAGFRLENTRGAKYVIDAYPVTAQGSYQYFDSIYVDEQEHRVVSYTLPKYGPSDAHGIKLDVNFAFDYYITEYIMGDIVGFAPSEQTIWLLAQNVKEEQLSDTPYLDLYSADGVGKFTRAFAEYMKNHPDELIGIAAESGLSYTQSMIYEKSNAIAAQVELIIESVLVIYDAFTIPAEETIYVTLTLTKPIGRSTSLSALLNPGTVETQVDNTLIVTGKLTNYEGKGLPGKAVSATSGDRSSIATTDANGDYRITINALKIINAGPFEVRVRFDGDNTNDPSTRIVSLNVIPQLATVKITQFSLAKTEYRPGETVTVNVGFANQGSIRAHVRASVDIMGTSNTKVNDMNAKEYWLNGGESTISSFTWSVPATASVGKYAVYVYLGDWDKFGPTFDFRAGDRGLTFTITKPIEAKLSLDSPALRVDIADNALVDTPVTMKLTNRGGNSVTGVQIAVSGPSSSWVKSKPSILTVNSGSTISASFLVNPPDGTRPGVYGIPVKFSGTDALTGVTLSVDGLIQANVPLRNDWRVVEQRACTYFVILFWKVWETCGNPKDVNINEEIVVKADVYNAGNAPLTGIKGTISLPDGFVMVSSATKTTEDINSTGQHSTLEWTIKATKAVRNSVTVNINSNFGTKSLSVIIDSR